VQGIVDVIETSTASSALSTVGNANHLWLMPSPAEMDQLRQELTSTQAERDDLREQLESSIATNATVLFDAYRIISAQHICVCFIL
jgi:signal transduction protein with GAF and PtsI domain